MVHALEKIHQLLKPEGRLIDIHPSGERPSIEVRRGSQASAEATVVGWLQETGDFIEYAQAGAALAQAVERGWFAMERKGAFEFVTCASSVVELREYLAQEWQDAVIEDDVAAQAEEQLIALGGEAELIVRERVLIARLRPVWPAGGGEA